MENSKPILIEGLLDQLNKKTDNDRLYYYYFSDIVHAILEHYQSALELPLEEGAKKVCTQAYDDVIGLLSKFIMNMLYASHHPVLCNTLIYTGSDSVPKGE